MIKIIACRIEHCLGCRSCEIACALEHSQSKDLHDAVLEHPAPQRRVTVEMAGAHGLPLQCRHCENGLCQLAGYEVRRGRYVDKGQGDRYSQAPGW